jgi:G2/mitotic-specific cyclin 3/4
MLAIGGLKAAAKRTVFADVSNTAKATSSVCDDSALPHKPAEFVKPLALQERSAGFFKPAHRSLNVAGPKVASVNTSTTAPSDLALVSTNTKLPLGETRLGQPHPVLPLANKRTLSKRSTAIYKDNVENEVSSQGATRPETAPTAPVHQSLAPRQHKSQPQLPSSTDQSVSHEAPSKFPGTVQSENVEPSNTIYQNTFEEPMMNPDEAYHSYSKLMEHDKEQPAIEVPKPTQTSDDRMHRHLPAPPLASEPEEYWEEDEEEEIYDEQGYTTAHSYRSRGENTTGGATTVLFPKVTNKAKKELAEAKNIVESARTPEEIEDEAWDTSMVAEYGDEIFAYMRELEVSFHS